MRVIRFNLPGNRLPLSAEFSLNEEHTEQFLRDLNRCEVVLLISDEKQNHIVMLPGELVRQSTIDIFTPATGYATYEKLVGYTTHDRAVLVMPPPPASYALGK